LKIAIEPMREEDIPQVVKIEEQSFPTIWPANAYKRELRENRLAHYIVAIDRGSRPAAARRGSPRGVERQPQQGRNGASALFRLIIRLLGKPETERRARTTSEEERRIVGYAGIWMMVDEAHLTTIAVSPEYRGHGIGELLLIRAMDLAMELNADVMTLEVRTTNRPAQALYEKYRFAQVGFRRGYYVDTNEDALIMTTENINTPSYRGLFEQLKRANAERLARSDG